MLKQVAVSHRFYDYTRRSSCQSIATTQDRSFRTQLALVCRIYDYCLRLTKFSRLSKDFNALVTTSDANFQSVYLNNWIDYLFTVAS